MSDIVLFGGTSEGRELAEFLCEQRIHSVVCVATEYGETVLHLTDPVLVHTGRLNAGEIEMLLTEEKPKLVIDATHPYADIVTKNITSACKHYGVEYLRIHRDSVPVEGCTYFPSLETAIEWINSQDGVVFSSLGAKSSGTLCGISNYKDRVYLRLLPYPSGIVACIDQGYPMAHIIGMQGPFSYEMNVAMFRETKAAILLTKEAGKAGGFPEKVQAALDCGMVIACIARPEDADGLSMEEAERRILEVCQ